MNNFKEKLIEKILFLEGLTLKARRAYLETFSIEELKEIYQRILVRLMKRAQ